MLQARHVGFANAAHAAHLSSALLETASTRGRLTTGRMPRAVVRVCVILRDDMLQVPLLEWHEAALCCDTLPARVPTMRTGRF